MSDKWQEGYDLMTKMMGENFAQTMQSNAASETFASDVGRLAVEFAFGSVWSRPGLELKQRSTVVIATLIALRSTSELKNHVRFGLNNGLTVEEIQEIIIQTVPYVGFPAVAGALTATIEVLRERGLAGETKTAEESGVL